ncbi:hypothetical protein Tco_1376739 [Tanacetum coccineum]
MQDKSMAFPPYSSLAAVKATYSFSKLKDKSSDIKQYLKTVMNFKDTLLQALIKRNFLKERQCSSQERSKIISRLKIMISSLKIKISSQRSRSKITSMQKDLQKNSQVYKAPSLKTSQEVKPYIVMKDKYPDQTVVIGRHLPTSFKKRLRDLLKANADIFTWTYSDMTGIPRIIMVGGRPFITENKLKELKHIEPRKQKKRGLVPKEAKHSTKK